MVAVSDGRFRRYDGRTVVELSFTVGIKHVYSIVLELPTKVDGRRFVLSKRSSACCRRLAKRAHAFVLFVSHQCGRELNLSYGGANVEALRVVS